MEGHGGSSRKGRGQKVKKSLWQRIFGLRGVTLPEDEKVGSFYKQMLIVAWPAALEGMLVSLMNSFDTMMVGRIGPVAIAAVGLCAQPRMILLLLVQAVCVGTTSVIARRRGEERQDAAVSCLKQSLVLVTGLGILITAAGYFLADPFLSLAGANEETLPDARIYFRIVAMAFTANCWSLCICAAQRGVGKTRITMITNMIANVVNVTLNYCLIEGHFGFPALGIRGAAIATAIGTCVSCVIAVAVVLKPGGYLSLPKSGRLRFDRETMSGLVKVGSGTIAESVFLRIGFLVSGRLVAGVSTAAYVSTQIVQQVSGLSFTLGDGVASACTALVGRSLGAKRKDHAMAYVKVSEKISLFMSLLLIAFIFFFKEPLARLFTDDQEILSASVLCFTVILAAIIPQNLRVVLSGCLRGAGDVKYVALVSLVSVAILRPALTWLFCYPLNDAFPVLQFGILGNWLSFGIDAIVRSVMLTHRVNKGKWLSIKL